MKIIKSFIQRVINNAGYTLTKNDYQPKDENSMYSALQRVKDAGISPRTIIDIGAAQGTWAEKALVYWPTANYHLIEPLTEQQPILAKLKAKHPNINYHPAVAGEAKGEVHLNVSDDLDGSGVYGENAGNGRLVPVIALDDLVLDSGGSCLIKFDTHGYELPILKGARGMLTRTDAIIIEVYGFHISPTCLLFHELTEHLNKLGFRLFDIVEIMRRPKDNCFWQADAVFLRHDHKAFSINHYE